MTSIHIALVSDQLLPNLIPVLAERPGRVLLVATEEMRRKGKPALLKRIIEENQIDVQIREGVPSVGLNAVREFALNLVADLESENNSCAVVLNATGGNKLMAMAFVETFRDVLGREQLRVIYVDTANDVIETLYPSGTEPEHLSGVLNVPTYLAAQGLIFRHADSEDQKWLARANERKLLTKYFGRNTHDLNKFFGVMNGFVHGSERNQAALVQERDGLRLDTTEHTFYHAPGGVWKEAMEKITEAGLLEWKGGACFSFSSAEAARYLGGFWLEEYVWHEACDCGFQDVRCNVVVTWSSTAKKDAPRSEFDLLIVHNNRMLVIECKTLRLDHADQTKEQNIVTKLESLGRNAGGTFGMSLLLSARPTTDTIRARCKSLGVQLREGIALRHLRQDLLDWQNRKSLIN